MNRKRAAGFTMLEMVIVLAILAVLTGIAVQSIGPVQDQARLDATNRILTEMRGSVLGPDAVSRDGELVAGGYLQDIGWLPGTANNLITGVHLPLAYRTRQYSATWRSYFGWNGPYLTPQIPRNGGGALLYDGYGNDFYGWPATDPWLGGLTTGLTTLYDTGAVLAVRSNGADQTTTADDLPDAAQPMIGAADWFVDLQGMNVTVDVKAGAVVTGSTPWRLRVVIPKWDEADPFVSLAAAARDLCEHYGAQTFPAVAAGASSIVIFGNGSPRRVPNGRRMLFVIRESDGLPVLGTGGIPACVELKLSRKISPAPVTIEVH